MTSGKLHVDNNIKRVYVDFTIVSKSSDFSENRKYPTIPKKSITQNIRKLNILVR